MTTIELGLDTFGDITDGPDGKPLPAAQVIRNIVAEATAVEARGTRVRYLNIGDPVAFGFRTPEHMVEAAVRAMRDGRNGYVPSAGIPEARAAVAAEYTTLLRASVSAATDTGLGDLREFSIVTEKMTALLVGITADYYLFAALAPGALVGRARFALRVAGSGLQKEFA